MLHQLFTNDIMSLRMFLQAWEQRTGPRIVTRLVPGAEPVEIKAVRQNAGQVEVQTLQGTWHTYFALYKETGGDQDE